LVPTGLFWFGFTFFMNVLFDTSALLWLRDFKVDVFGQARELGATRLLVLEPCLNELKKKAPGLVKPVKKECEIVEAEGRADDAIVAWASQNDCAVATGDRGLAERLKSNGIQVIVLRNYGCLAVT